MVNLYLDQKLQVDFPAFVGLNPAADLFGVEVELEGSKLKDRVGALHPYWTSHVDGSLRARNPEDDALEYVFTTPLELAISEMAIRGLCKFLSHPSRKVYPSYRTSIHVHINCLQETRRTIYNYITIATILDELLVSQNGEHRVGNNFCLRMRDAEGVLADLIKSLDNYGNILGIRANDRYGSVNVASILKFGTIEFRSLECTTDADRIIHWVRTLQAMKESARDFADPREVISQFSRTGPAEFLNQVLGEENAQKYLTVPGRDRMLFDGMRLAQDFAFCKDWSLPDSLGSADRPIGNQRRKIRVEDILINLDEDEDGEPEEFDDDEAP